MKKFKIENVIFILILGGYLYDRLFINIYTNVSILNILDILIILVSAYSFKLVVRAIRKGYLKKELKALLIDLER